MSTGAGHSGEYISTRGRVRGVGFSEAVLMGLATDGGLLLPSRIPEVSSVCLSKWAGLSYPELAAEVMGRFTGDDIGESDLASLVTRGYASFDHPEIVPLREVGPLFILELFHGPTLAFKDLALQFLGNLFEYILDRTGEQLNIIGATSGDTGSAAIAGVRGRRNMQIFIMHPHGRTSPIQERQMTTVLDSNVHNIAVEGTFDDGQRVLKKIFNDIAFKEEFRLGAVNSVNWARVMAQIVYYFYAAFRVRERTGCEQIQACVPTGNFGDIFAGYLARRMGAPISRLILATNENDILSGFFNEGVYRAGEVTATTSPSMDIQVASNFERYLYYRVGEDPDRVSALMREFSSSGEIRLEGRDPAFAAGSEAVPGTSETIRKYWEEYQYLLDPHTAVGVSVAERFLREGQPSVCLATAHPAKFPGTIRKAVREENAAGHPAISRLEDLPTKCTVLPATENAVKQFIRDVLRA